MCGIAVTLESEERCYEMLNQMKHRGLPGREYQRVVKAGKFFIGHVRLPIIDLTLAQNQPMQDESLTLAFNGEIYNYKDLGRKYDSDTELLFDVISATEKEFNYARLKDFFNIVDGMYAVAYHHQNSDNLFIITDFLNKKQLYYDTKNQEIASEIKALRTNGLELDKHYMSEVAMFGYHRGPRTPFLNIRMIPPNWLCMFNGNTIRPLDERFVNLDPTRPDIYLTHLKKAVKDRLLASDIPVGFLLSGGLDSSLICSIAKEYSSEPIKTFSIENGETEYSEEMADLLQSDHTVLKAGIGITEEILYYNETPVDLGSVTPQFILCKAIADAGMNVCITGDGADELFGGYTRMSEYIGLTADTQYSDVFRELPFYHLPRLDKMSMAHTVELRSPFLAKEVIRSALSLNYSFRIRKRWLKTQSHPYLPDRIINRPKVPLRSSAMTEDREKFKHDRLRAYYELIEEKGGLFK